MSNTANSTGPSPSSELDSESVSESAEDFPVPKIRDTKRSGLGSILEYGTRLWWLTLLCVLIAVVLVLSALGGAKQQIVVSFGSGHGIEPGDALRHLGIEVGRVISVDLQSDLGGVDVEIAIDREAAGLACEGSRFWIERPRLSLPRVTGLETIVGSKYVGVIPGPAGARPATKFRGLETPPTLKERTAVDITIRFKDGHGLAVGDVLKHRGIVVGEVTLVGLRDNAVGVIVQVRLVESAIWLARAGSQFWIARPQVSMSEIRGLETIVQGSYLAVLPGPENAEPLVDFDGLERAPALLERAEGGLEIVLESTERSGLQAGAPVNYRGIRVGRIMSVGLATDAASVEARAYISPEHRQLIRDNTYFWSISGIEVSMGLTGVTMDVDSFSTLAAGGVALVTPDPPAALVTTGHRFEFHDEEMEGWRDWRPRIPIGSVRLPDGLSLPHPMRAALRWKERNIVGLSTERQRDAWVLPLEGDRLLGPADLLTFVEGSAQNRSVLALAGNEFPISKDNSRVSGHLGLIDARDHAAQFESLWPLDRIRTPQSPEDCLFVGDPQEILALSTGRITVQGGLWMVDASMILDTEWHGACVVSRRDGALIGIVFLEKGRAKIVPLNRSLGLPSRAP